MLNDNKNHPFPAMFPAMERNYSAHCPTNGQFHHLTCIMAPMKFLFDLFPIILFFATFKYGDAHPETATAWLGAIGIVLDNGAKPGVFLATAVAIIATFCQIGWVKFRHGKVDTMLWVSLGIIVVFGGATLLLHDENFIKWKPTVLYWLFTTVLTVSAVLFKKNLIKAMMQKQITVPEAVWGKLNASWAGFFAIMGVINLYVAFNFSTDTWVNFKLFGSMGLMLIFVLGQSMLLSKYMDDK
jgi:intracellular septation protein